MTPRRTRMLFVSVVVAGVCAAAILAFNAIGENMLFFFSPTQIQAGEAPTGRKLRMGGLVVMNSVQREANGLTVGFKLTDQLHSIKVRYTGILPDLFREGQGVVVLGSLDSQQVFQAEEVLAKHDENYMPPEVAEALKIASEGGQMENPHSGKKP
jgi:cytochrome c-type biogenesis protein CcmE